MKRLLLILFLIPTLIFAQNATDGGKVPLQGNQIGGVGPDGQFHFAHLGNDGSIPVTTTPASGTARTVALTVASASGTVTSGARRVTIAPSSDFAGTILGTTISGVSNGAAFTFAAPQNDTLPAIAYTRSAGSLTILEVR